ncbi:MAG TPA: hypothetical protein VG271_11855 [Beijerinckiaceae bacterium]|nr:hypothetical protein [Beijerinckiaceae bacterium]
MRMRHLAPAAVGPRVLLAPPLPEDQARRLALIVPQLMRFGIVLRDEAVSFRAEVLEELRAMLSHHLDRTG